jgi:ABC-type antimicrobial peptide transport system permease subunit
LVFAFSSNTIGIAASTIIAVMAITAMLVYRRIHRLDLIAVLKSRE